MRKTLFFILYPLCKSYFYIYEWPSDLDIVWPPPGAKLHSKSGYDHGFYGNNGAGDVLISEIGLFQTWQFSLYRNLISRLRVSKYRTKNPSNATAFIIPFDLGVNSYIDHVTGQPRLAAPLGRSAGWLLKNHCNGDQSDIFWKNRGHDHYILFSITAYQMVGMMVKEFFMFVCQNCTVLTIETSPTKTAIPGRTRKHWYAVPYPSSFHWHERIIQLPWLNTNSRDVKPSSGQWEMLPRMNQRYILSLFIGSTAPSQPSSKRLRVILQKQCTEDLTSSCHWYETAHACNGVVNATKQMLLFRSAVFCPAPAGDSVTRKSIFDSLVAGCIPVLFSRASLSQYSWHVSDEDVDRVSVYIPMSGILNGSLNFITVLKSITIDDIQRKQKRIAELAPTLQYAVVPSDLDLNNSTWSPPFRDAADVVIDHILDRRTVEPITGFSNKELLQQHQLQKYMLTNHEDYGAMRAVGEEGGGGGGGGRARKRKGGRKGSVGGGFGNSSASEAGEISKIRSLTRISTVCG